MKKGKLLIRILSTILTFTVLCASLPLLVFADQIEWEENTNNEATYNEATQTSLTDEEKYDIFSAVGVESHFPLVSQSVVAGHTGYLNLYSSELTYIMPLISTTDNLLPCTVSLVYNSAIAGAMHDSTTTLNAYDQTYAPRGMKLNICETLYSTFNQNGVRNYYYEDPDGTTHRFVPNKGKYTEDSGLQFTITHQDGNVVLNDIAGNQKLFTPMGTEKYKLERITDKYGNSVKFDFDNIDRPVSINLIPNGGTAIQMLKLTYNTAGMLSMVYNPVTLDAVILRYGTGASLEYLDYVKCKDGVTVSTLTKYETDQSENTNVLQIANVYCNFGGESSQYSIDNVSGRGIYYVYQNDTTLRIYEMADDIGQETDIIFKNGYTEVRTSGNDDELGNADDIITRYVFDGDGRAKSVYSTSLDGKEVYGATLGEYQAEDSVAKNKIKTTTTLGGSPVNLLYNGGFESYALVNGSYWFNGWYKYGNVGRGNESSELPGNGMYCAYFGPEIDEPAAIYQDVTLLAGDYTLSFDIDRGAMEHVHGSVRVYYGDNTDYIHYADIPRNTTLLNGSLGKFSTTFTVPAELEGETLRIVIEFTKLAENATIYSESMLINNAVLEAGNGASEYSFVTFGGFEGTSEDFTISDVWEGYYYVDNVTDGFGTALVLTGEGENTSYAQQRIVGTTPMSPANATYNYNFIVSGFVMVNGGITANSTPRIRIDAHYRKQSGSNETVVKSFYFEFLEGVDGWQFFAEKFNAGVDTIGNAIYDQLMYVNIVCEYDGPVGSVAYFDNLSVVLDEGNSAEEYAYYPNEHTNSGMLMIYRYFDYYEHYVYDINNRISIFANNKGEMTEYVYDGLGRVIYEISSNFYDLMSSSTHFPIHYVASGLYEIDDLITKTPKSLTAYTYDNYGLATSVTVYGSIVTEDSTDAITQIANSGYYTTSGTKKLAAEYTYITESGSRIFGALETESRDEVYNARYFYDGEDGKLLATVNVGARTGSVNEYDEYDRLVNVYPASYSVTNQTYSKLTNAESVTYSYDGAHRLSSIETESTVYGFEYDGFDNRTSISAGDNEIVSYEYNDYNGKLKKVIYANGLTTEYEYNDIDLLTEIWYTENEVKTLAYSYEYNADGSLYKITDEKRGESTEYRYDGQGKLLGAMQYSKSDMEIDFSVAYTYRGINDLFYSTDVFLNYYVAGVPYDVYSGLVYYYNADETLDYTAINFPSATGTIRYTYDEFGRVSSISADYKKALTVTVQRDESYTYRTYGDNNTDGLVSRYESVINKVPSVYDYTYDKRGYILTETKDGKKYTYTYDDLGQLISVSKGSMISYYTYDNAGNILTVERQISSGGNGEIIFGERIVPPGRVTVKSYTYSSSEWGDLLTAFNDTAITYDALGNPLSYYNGSSYTFTWQGRRLVGAVKGTNNMSFTYDDNGLRTTKTVNGVTTEYFWNGNLLAAEKTPTYLIVYNYDASGRPIGMAYRDSTYAKSQWDVYWFDLNLHGDVVGVYNNDGAKLIAYSYDAWGECSTSYFNGGASTTAIKNNIRYRSYYYDTDLGLYYLQSRYYDPNTYRFINADGYVSTGQGILGYNMFAYCGNNPVNCVDPTGEAWWYWLCYAVSPVVTTVLATANDIYQIASGAVKPLENDEQDSVQIQNSNKILTPMATLALSFTYNHINLKSKDVIEGSTYGVFVEWKLHNIAYDVLTVFNGKDALIKSSAHADFGRTIFSDTEHDIASVAMHSLYINGIVRHPISVIYDIIIEFTGGR